MDFLVPLVNGIECMRIFRKGQKDVPVIMITAYASEQCKTEAYLAGCNEYVLKPIYPEKIVSLLEKYLLQEKKRYSCRLISCLTDSPPVFAFPDRSYSKLQAFCLFRQLIPCRHIPYRHLILLRYTE